MYLLLFSHEMKKLLSPLYSFIPCLVEYLSSEAEEREIDSSQARKCCDFKRMVLESVKEGGGVGVPVPIGYDDVQVWIRFLTDGNSICAVTGHCFIHKGCGKLADAAILCSGSGILPHWLLRRALHSGRHH